MLSLIANSVCDRHSCKLLKKLLNLCMTRASRLRQTADVNLYHVTKFPPYFSPTLYCFYAKMSSFIPVLTIGIVLDSFYLLVFYYEKFSA